MDVFEFPLGFLDNYSQIKVDLDCGDKDAGQEKPGRSTVFLVQVAPQQAEDDQGQGGGKTNLANKSK